MKHIMQANADRINLLCERLDRQDFLCSSRTLHKYMELFK
jgi:hypothetical protein